ncbi:MAG: sigma-54-dependent Fis family transcriptional regulator [Cryobacterium sp.]|nr:sigma-54-dependent Fis family transcriptional regulator [Oligoflexia bacterium]
MSANTGDVIHSGSNALSILLVDDDLASLGSTRKILEFAGYSVETAGDGQAAIERIRLVGAPRIDLVISDVRMPRMTGLEFLRALRHAGKTIPVVLMTAYGRVEDAVWAMKLGAVDFLSKPFKRATLLEAVEISMKRMQANATAAANSAVRAASATAKPGTEISTTGKSDAAGKRGASRIAGRSLQAERLRAWVEQVGTTTATVLIQGESGTGKEQVARALHETSPRAQGPFMAINCAALPENLLESELFGYEKGAFTGAVGAKMGLFEAASGGTLFLDEIGDLAVSLQAKLLRVLQESEVRRLGSSTSKRIDVRVISATHQPLKRLVTEGRFRQDLLFRLEVVSLDLPALRARLEDLPDFTSLFVHEAATRHGKSVVAVAPDAFEVLSRYAWPGNIRELQNAIERAVIFASSPVVQAKDLPPHVLELAGKGLGLEQSPHSITIPVGTPLREVEEMMIRRTLELTQGDKNLTAKLLGINSRTIYRKLKEDGAEIE